MTTNTLIISNPSTLRLPKEKFAIIPTEEGDFDYPLLIEKKGSQIKVSIVEVENVEDICKKVSPLKRIFEDTAHVPTKDGYIFEIDNINKIFSDYTEDILPRIIEFLHEYTFIDENIFVEKLVLLRQKYSIEYIIATLDTMTTQEIDEIINSGNALLAFESAL